jgi:two-component system response regulator LytT
LRSSSGWWIATAQNPGKEAEPLPQIVFATAYDQYAVRAFDVNAVDYLLKPFDRARVEQALERVRAHGRRRRGQNPLPLESQIDAAATAQSAPGGSARFAARPS